MKHAYLIIVHDNYYILEKLVRLLDDPCNDIYIHVDRKSGFSPAQKDSIRNMTQYSTIFVFSKVRVKWGTFSLVECELSLFEKAAQKGYDYYHLLSGTDLPLKPQKMIQSFFEQHRGKEFIHFDRKQMKPELLNRIRYYYFFPMKSSYAAAFFLKCVNHVSLLVQKFLHVDRVKNADCIFQKGCEWVSVTHDFVQYLLSRKEWIYRTFRHTASCDEIYKQTLCVNSPFKDHLYNSRFDNDYDACMRFIDWERGSPYTWREQDFDLLMNSHYLFARKFNERVDRNIVDRVFAAVASQTGTLLFDRKENCSGCTACRSICPKNAIAMETDEKGFYHPHIDPERCVGCGLCRRVCPFHSNFSTGQNLPVPDVYAVKHKSDKIRMKSSSGGMFTAISDYVLNLGGTVYGAAFDDNFMVCHRRAATKAERDAFRGSKYVQSDLGDVFSQVKNDLTGGRTVLFSGTPCQTAGLSSFLACGKTNAERLYLCDLVCHGTPSPQIFNDYLAKVKRKYNSAIQSLAFRYKPAGWRTQAIKIEFCNRKFYQSSAADDIYYRLFLPNIILRPSCHHCPFASLRRPSDLTIGDFWGIEKAMPEFEDEKGVSLVLVNTEKGRRLFQAVKPTLDARPLPPDQGMQMNLKQPSSPSPKADAFWADYQTRGFEFTIRKYAGAGLKGYMKRVSKKVLKRLGLFDTVKSLLHPR